MIVLPRTRDRELVDCYHGGLHREMFKVLRLVGRLAWCCVGCFGWPVVFWRRRLACDPPNEDRQVELRPGLGRPTPADDSSELRTYGCRFPRRLQGRQRASPTSANTEPAAWCRPRGALGGGSRGWCGCKTSAGTHRRLGMRRGSLSSLDSVVKARPHEFVMLFWFDMASRSSPSRRAKVPDDHLDLGAAEGGYD